MDVFEAMDTCRAMRYFKPDPIAADLVDRLIHAATRAPSPGNSQGWDFVLMTEPAAKRAFGEAVNRALSGMIADLRERLADEPSPDPVQARMLEGAGHLASSLGQVPLIVLVCGRPVYPPDDPQEMFIWSALYPAAQNILLAARALGLGSCFTTFHMLCEAELKQLLGIPEEVRIAATIPVGWPARDFGPLARRPIESFVHRERW